MNTILTFWFETLTPQQWWVVDPQLDTQITAQFSAVHHQAVQEQLVDWRSTPEGRLAEIIVLDQFSRNMFRGTPQAFAYDKQALVLAQAAVAAGDDQKLTPIQRSFIYLPYMHSESQTIHEQAMQLYAQPGLESNLDFEIQHKQIIDRFGRYPHRNDILKRDSTPEEIAFLKEPGSSF